MTAMPMIINIEINFFIIHLRPANSQGNGYEDLGYAKKVRAIAASPLLPVWLARFGFVT
jgi:hypothetical protein